MNYYVLSQGVMDGPFSMKLAFKLRDSLCRFIPSDEICEVVVRRVDDKREI